MRFTSALDFSYVLSSLWGVTDPQVCSIVSALPPIRPVVTWVSSSGAPISATAFVNVNVVPMDAERVLTNQTVVVEHGLITALGPVDKVSVPGGATRIDGQGKYLMPGIADMHAHLNMFLYSGGSFVGDTSSLSAQAKELMGSKAMERRLYRYLANGITTVRQTNSWIYAIALRQRLKANEIIGPRLYVAAPLTRWLEDSAASQPDLGVEHISKIYRSGAYDFIDIPEGLFGQHRPVFDSLLAVARRLGLPSASHSHSASLDEILAFGATGSIDHLGRSTFRDIRKQWRDGDTAAFMSAVQARAAAFQRAGVWVTPTMTCQRGNGAHDTRFVLKLLQQAGVGLLMAGDPVNGGPRSSPSWVHQDLVQMRRAGLTPYQTLLTGTRNVAEYLGKRDSSGTVTVGKWADLVMLTGNPLEDVRYLREPAGVMIGGRWLDRVMLDQHLLASPKRWFEEEILETFYDDRRPHEAKQEARKKFSAVVDSIDESPSARGSATQAQVRKRLVEELELLREILTPIAEAADFTEAKYEQERFDILARVWIREQVRQGFPVTIRGVRLVP